GGEGGGGGRGWGGGGGGLGRCGPRPRRRQGRWRVGSPRDKGRKAGDRLDQRAAHDPLTVYVFSTPVLCAPSGALFFLGLRQRGTTRAVVWQSGHTREKFPAASRRPPRRSFVKLGPGRRAPSRRRGRGARNTPLAH